MDDPASQQPDKNLQNFILSKILPILLGMGGVYVAFTTQWKPFFLQHLYLTIPLAIIVGFILTVLYDLFIKPPIIWIGSQIIRTFSRTKHHYCEDILHYYQFSSPIGLHGNVLTLEFLKIFVQPSIKQILQLEDVSPTPITEETSPITSNTNNNKIDTQTIDHFLTEKESDLVIILGSPGSGKTALLQYLTLTLAKKKFHPALLWLLSKIHKDFKLLHCKIPILLSLSHPDQITAITNDKQTKREEQFKIANALELQGMRDIPNLTNWIDNHLKKGNCLIMLDGLDDIADSNTRKQVFKWIKRETKFHRENRFLLTSRPQNFSGKEDLSSGMQMRLEILSFGDSDIEKFVSKMCTTIAERLPSLKTNPAKTDPKVLLERLQANPAVWELAHNPLLLTMSVTTHIFTNDELPEKRVAFYKQICNALLGQLKEERGVTLSYTKEQLLSVFQLLSYTLMQQEQTSNIIIEDVNKLNTIEDRIKQINIRDINEEKDNILEQFLEVIFASTGLLKRTGEEGSYSYQLFHSTVKEYLVAAHLHETRNGQELVDKIDKPEWKEIILLFCALEDASAIIDACLTKGTEKAVDLAFACEKEALSIKDQKVLDALVFEHEKQALKKQQEATLTETDRASSLT